MSFNNWLLLAQLALVGAEGKQFGSWNVVSGRDGHLNFEADWETFTGMWVLEGIDAI